MSPLHALPLLLFMALIAFGFTMIIVEDDGRNQQWICHQDACTRIVDIAPCQDGDTTTAPICKGNQP